MTPARPRGDDYDPEVVELVRRTLRTVAEATPVDEEQAPPHLGSRRLGNHARAGTEPIGSRRRLVLGAGAVVGAAAALLAFVALGNRGGTPPSVDTAHGRGAPATPARADLDGPIVEAATVALAPAPTDVAVPGWVPTGFEYENLEVLDPLEGAVEANMYTSGEDVLAAFVTDVPETASRLAERMQPWGGDAHGIAPTTRRDDGYLAFTRGILNTRRATNDVEALTVSLADGATPADAAPEGYELVASVTTTELPEAGRFVSVEYGMPDAAGALIVQTRQGTLSPDVAAFLYPDAAPSDIRGRVGFRAEGSGGAGSLWIWQEAPGLVVSVDAKRVDPATLDSFVAKLAVVTEDTWVTLRVAAGEPAGADGVEPLPGLHPRELAQGELAGRPYTLEALDGGSLARGVVLCHRLSIDGAPFGGSACGPVDGVASKRQGDTVVVWAVVPAEVVAVQSDVPPLSDVVIGADPTRPTDTRQVLLVFPAGPGMASIDFRDGAGNVIDTRTTTLS